MLCELTIRLTAVRDAISTLLVDNARRERIGGTAHTKVTHDFDTTNMWAALAEVLRSRADSR